MGYRVLIASLLLSPFLGAQEQRVVIRTPEGRFTVRVARLALPYLDHPEAAYR